MHPPMPTPEQIAVMPPFDRLGLDRVCVVATGAAAQEAAAELLDSPVWGFDTESKPTFRVGEASDGPHVVQLATLERAFVFQLHDPACRTITGDLLARAGMVKAGFGLQDDRRRITHKLGVDLQGVLDLDTNLHARGYRRQMGVKAAVATLFQRRLLKSKKAATSNWAARDLTEAQVLYAANDAWAALKVYEALGLSPAPGNK